MRNFSRFYIRNVIYLRIISILTMWRCKLGFITRLKKEPIYRRRFYLTLALCFSYMTLGCVVLQIGTALPDLMGLFDIDLEAASWLLAARYIGFLAGCVLFGILFDKFNRLMLMFVCSVGMGVTTLFTPYLVNYPLALALRVTNGLFCAGIDNGANTIVASIWGVESGPYMQLLYLFYSFGGIVCSFVITGPFMAPKETDDSLSDYDARENDNNLTSPQRNSANESWAGNETEINEKQIFETDIEYAFITVSVLCALSSIPFVAMVYKRGFDVKAGNGDSGVESAIKVYTIQTKDDETQTKEDETSNCEPETNRSKPDLEHSQQETNPDQESRDARGDKVTGCSLIIVLICVVMISALYSAAEQCMGDYIVTFCLDYFNWGNQAAASINSLYWLVSFLGGIGGVILVQVLSSGRLLLMAHICWVAAFIGATVASVLHMDSILWIYVPISGFFMVQIVPASISWTEESVCKVTGKIMTVIMFATGFGLATNPAFVGYMMQIYSYACFVYILMGEALLCFMFFLIGYIVAYVQT